MTNRPKTFQQGQLVVVYWEHGLADRNPVTGNTFAHVLEVQPKSCRVRFLDGFYATIGNDHLVVLPTQQKCESALRLAEIEASIAEE
jgi:hypothetical protein